MLGAHGDGFYLGRSRCCLIPRPTPLSYLPYYTLSTIQNDSLRIDALVTLSSHVSISVQSHIICIPIHSTFSQPSETLTMGLAVK
jgi:hypothetical protein